MNKPSPDVDDVLRAFDALASNFVPSGALRGHLEAEGFDHAAIATAINEAIEEGALALSTQGSLYRP